MKKTFTRRELVHGAIRIIRVLLKKADRNFYNDYSWCRDKAENVCYILYLLGILTKREFDIFLHIILSEFWIVEQKHI